MPDLSRDQQKQAREIMKMMGGDVPEGPNYTRVLAHVVAAIVLIIVYFLILKHGPPLLQAVVVAACVISVLVNGPKLLAKLRGK